ncbi:MAG: hypothetical protein ABI325_08760 [Ginsengibacter sp.]
MKKYLLSGISAPKDVEEWEVTPPFSQVSSNPAESAIIASKQQKLNTTIKNGTEGIDTF